MQNTLTLALLCFSQLVQAVEADNLRSSKDLPLKKAYRDRQERVNQWYGPARFGIFCHWGLFTGGGDSSTDEPQTFHYNTIAEFEAVAEAPEAIAHNLVTAARQMGARYLTFTLLHSCDRYAVMFPAKTPGFKMKTSKDYIGALAACCQQEKIPLLLYLCTGPEHGFTKEGSWLEESLRDGKNYVAATKGLVDELAVLHPGQISGFWIDGRAFDLPAHMRQRFPGCVVIHNNDQSFGDTNIDYGTTEFLSGPADPDYSRPTGLIKTHPRWNILPPRRDFNEDIPSAGSWWFKGADNPGYHTSPYFKSPTFVVRQLVSSLGQRRQWNFALGVGPMINGNLSPDFEPMIDCLHNFFAWASDSIYDTVGGEGSALNPGWWNDGAYGSVTVSRKDPALLYVHVTTAPKSDSLQVPNNGYTVASVTDLRTGNSIGFTDSGFLIIRNHDWSDVQTFGDKIFKVRLAATRQS
jgi:alpha-L-fucosidase